MSKTLRHMGTITAMSDIKIPFESRKMFEKVEVDHKEVQVGQAMTNNSVQTELLGIDAASGKDRDFRLVSIQI